MGPGVAIREFPLKPGHGFADYLLFVRGYAVGVLEAKKAGTTLSGVEVQTRKYSEGLGERFDNWLAQQRNTGREFTGMQRKWLEMIRDHVAQSLEIGMDDFSYTPFVEEGGLGKAAQVIGEELHPLIQELNEALAA